MLSRLVTVSFASAFVAQAVTIHVPGDVPQIQMAIEAANEGDTVLVQPGTYVETLDFLGKGITVIGTAPAVPWIVASTVVDADSLGEVVAFYQSEDSTSVLAGLTLTGGSGHEVGPGSTSGGGIYIDHASPTIHHCIVRGNSVKTSYPSAGRGGGILCRPNSSPRIYACLITENHADRLGGGISCTSPGIPKIEDCTISHNVASSDHPRQSGFGGGVNCDGISYVQFRNCTIVDNFALKGGGGVVAIGSNPSFVNCTISRNSSPGLGGGIHAHSNHNAKLRGCKVLDNVASGAAGLGGGIYVHESGKLDVRNTTIVGNSAGGEGGGVYSDHLWQPFMRNCILWGNSPDEIGQMPEGFPPWVDYSIVGGGWPGVGNLSSDPVLIDHAKIEAYPNPIDRWIGDTFYPRSPAIDAGHPLLEDRVSDRHPRWPNWYANDSRSDMGAYGGPDNAGWVP